jgi:cytosine/adenosine deaminase-related metal-dependent hydrolase
MPPRTTALRGPALTFAGDPFAIGLPAAMRHESDAIVAMADGQITHFGPAADVSGQLPLSMLKTMGAAYQTAQLGGHALPAPLALYLEDRIGSLAVGMEADVIVMNLESTPLIEFRMKRCDSFEEALFVQITMGDERAIAERYVAGRLT